MLIHCNKEKNGFAKEKFGRHHLNNHPGGSDSKASAYNAGDLGSIPGPGRCPGEGNGNPPVFLPGESHRQQNLTGYAVHGVAKSQIPLSN